jgi:hypothetical protein
VAIITHHPIIIHFESVGISLLPVDEYFSFPLFPGVSFVDLDAAFV